MKKFCAFIAEFSPSDSISFLLVFLLMFEKHEYVILQDFPEVVFLDKQRPLFLQ